MTNGAELCERFGWAKPGVGPELHPNVAFHIQMLAGKKFPSLVGRMEGVSNLIYDAPHFLEMPASSRYHNSFTGGFALHSLSVAEFAVTLSKLLVPEWYSGKGVGSDLVEESVWICGFLHDWDKLGLRTENGWVPRYVRLDGQWRYNKEGYGESNRLGVSILELLDRYGLNLTDAERFAIRFADGQYIPENKVIALKEHALGQIVHWSDYWVGIFREPSPGREDWHLSVPNLFIPCPHKEVLEVLHRQLW